MITFAIELKAKIQKLLGKEFLSYCTYTPQAGEAIKSYINSELKK